MQAAPWRSPWRLPRRLVQRRSLPAVATVVPLAQQTAVRRPALTCARHQCRWRPHVRAHAHRQTCDADSAAIQKLEVPLDISTVNMHVQCGITNAGLARSKFRANLHRALLASNVYFAANHRWEARTHAHSDVHPMLQVVKSRDENVAITGVGLDGAATNDRCAGAMRTGATL